jgi:hypothetical protein
MLSGAIDNSWSVELHQLCRLLELLPDMASGRFCSLYFMVWLRSFLLLAALVVCHRLLHCLYNHPWRFLCDVVPNSTRFFSRCCLLTLLCFLGGIGVFSLDNLLSPATLQFRAMGLAQPTTHITDW